MQNVDNAWQEEKLALHKDIQFVRVEETTGHSVTTPLLDLPCPDGPLSPTSPLNPLLYFLTFLVLMEIHQFGLPTQFTVSTQKVR